jgi:methenyltetrahydromethanopterin cyclohydrolase
MSAAGSCPIAPVTKDSLRAMGMTNDGIIYYGNVFMTVKTYDEVLERLPSETSPSYGKPFFQTFKEANYDFYKIDKFMFAPAKVTINDAQSDMIRKLGRLNEAVLAESFGF